MREATGKSAGSCCLRRLVGMTVRSLVGKQAGQLWGEWKVEDKAT